MKFTATAIKLGVVAVALLLFTAGIAVVFGQIRFDRTYEYSAEFSSAGGLRPGQFVRAAGVEVGKVTDIRLINGGTKVVVDFGVERSLPLYESTTAHIRYLNLLGDRYLELKRGDGEGAERVLPARGFIPRSHTHPALDLDALIGGFQPLFRSLDPEKVGTLATSIVTVFQGQGGTINDLLDQTAELTSTLAERDAAIGDVVKNLNVVLDTTVRHRAEFDSTVGNFERLITGLKDNADPLADGVAHISNVSGTLADVLGENQELLQKIVGEVEQIAQPLIDNRDEVNETVQKLPGSIKKVGRTASYGDFLNFYTCDTTLLMNGLQPGGAVRKVRMFQQPSGRCMPQ